MTWAIPTDEVDPEHLAVRFFHAAKVPMVARAKLDGSALLLLDAAVAGVTVERLTTIAETYDLRCRAAAALLAQTPAVVAALDALDLPTGARVVALGDSITDDVLSWASILSHLFVTHRRDLEVSVVNLAATGSTTQEALTSFDLVVAQRPDVVVQLLGTNDARRYLPIGETTTSVAETRRNLRLLRDAAMRETGGRTVLLTPPPCDDELVAAWEPFRDQGLRWRASDVQAVAEQVLAVDPEAIDVHADFARQELRPLLLPDGLHPGLRGQLRLAALALDGLARVAT